MCFILNYKPFFYFLQKRYRIYIRKVLSLCKGYLMFRLEKVKYKNIIDIEDLQIDTGKITCITGESGAGKSTLLKLLNKIISPDSGKIYYKDQDIEKLDSISYRRQIPTLSQFPVIFDGSIRDNLQIGLKFSNKQTKSDDELKEVLKKVRLDKSLDEDPNKLSGGEKQRLCIGRILLMDTDTILLDEPSASLDSKTEHEIIDLIYREIKDCGKTMIYITHTKDIAEEFSDVLIRLDKGKIVGIDNFENDKGVGQNE